MKAITRSKYGGPEVLELEEVEKPTVKKGHILVKIKANSANPADWHIIRGEPFLARIAFGLFKPKQKIVGADFSGVVEELGAGVVNFKVGDHVFGESLKGGAFAQFICVPADACGKMPEGASFPVMASVPVAGLTAWQTLSTHAKLQKGEKVLINGSSGGVGHFAVQIAKALGADVTAVCSSRNVEFVKELGADHVIAYDVNSVHDHIGNFNVIFDAHGNLFLGDFKRMGERGVVVGFTSVGHMMKLVIKGKLSKFPLTDFTAKANTKDLEQLAELIDTGKVKPYIEKTYPFTEIPKAIEYIEAMRTRGKVVMVWAE